MNENFYRLVFNAVRGMLVAVQESAVGCGKGRHAGTKATGGARVFVPVLWFTTLVAAMMGLPPAPDARAQTLPIQVDKGAPGARPYVNTAANGTPVVNIAAPNRPGGTSVNNFTQYNVGSSGVVINNSGQNSQTQIAGWVQGNMQLGNSHAGTIVQQVTAPNPSQLLGMQEIAGNRASLVIVNPAGITCSGCGTINADRFTLSTGRALYGPDGSLSGFDVSQGNIAIGAQGLSSPQAQVDLMARSIQVNGEIWSQYLAAIAGANQIDHQTLGATAQAGTGPAPQFALDASALGSMYAGAIRLVGTEKGVGFNLGNNIAASTGDIVVDANGDVRILQTARLQAQGTGVLAGANIDNAGAMTTRGGIQATAAGALTNSGLLSSGGNLLAQANQITNTGTIGAGTDASGNVTQAGAANIAARTGIQSSGSILSGGDANLSAPNLNLNGGTLVSHGTANLSASGDIDLRAARVEGNAVQVAAGGSLDNRQGTIAAGANGGTLEAVSILNRGGSVSSGGALAVTAQSLDNTSGTVAGTGATTIRAASTVNRDGVIGSTQGSLSVAGGAVQNDLGQLSAGGNLTVDTAGQALSNRQGVLAGNGDVAIDADALDNDAGAISAYKAMTITGARVDNTKGAIVSGADLAVSADALTNTGGQLASKSDATLRVANTLDNTAGFIHASGTLDAQAATILNASTRGGTDSKPLGMEGGTVKVAANAIDNTDGALRADTALTATSATLNNTLGEVTAGGTAQIGVGATTNTDGLLAANQKLGVTGTSLTGDGKIQSQGDVSIGLQSDFRNTNVVAAGRNLRVDTSGDIANDGTMSAGNDLDVRARNIGNTGELYGRVSNRLRADQSVYNAGLIDGGAVRIDAGTTVTNVQRIFGDAVSIGAGQRIVNDQNAATGQGGVIASRSGDINLGAPEIVNREQALIYSSRDLNVGRALDENGAATGRADTLINASATIDVARDANINAALVTNRNDHFSTERVDTGTVEEFYYRLNGSTEKIDPATTMIFLPTTTGTGLGKTASGGGDLGYLDADDYKRLVLPSTQYPFSEFGPPFDWSRQLNGAPGQVDSRSSTTWPVGKAYYAPQCAIYIFCNVEVPTYVYGPGDAIWGKLGVAPPDSAPPPIPACWTRPTDCTPADNERIAAFRAWEDANRDRYAELDRKIVAFNNDFQSRLVASWNIERRETRVQDEIVKTSDPARILVGGNASFGGAVVNDKSQILVGGTLTVPAPVQNLAYEATRFEDTSGSTQYTRPCKLSRCYDTMVMPTVRVEIPTRLAEGETLHNVGAIGRTGSAPDAASGPGPVAAVPTLRELTLAGKGDGRLGDATIRQVTPTLAMPQNALFRVNVAPGAQYLIETDPRFTNQRKWLSSDFMLTQLGRDPNNVLKRLGDGFYEARLVADAVMLGTGQRFVGDYADNEAQYIGLMKAGVTFAQQFNLTIGTELTAEQMKQLTSDMVWLVEKTVTLPDGTTQQVLVPQVYLMSHVGEASASARDEHAYRESGFLSSKSTHTIDANARTDAVGSTFSGDAVAMQAGRDMTIAGSTVAGTNDVDLSAARNLTITTTETQASAHTFKEEKKSGFGATGSGLSYGNRNQKDTINDNSITQVGSLVGSTDGSVRLTAGSTLTVKGSDLIAKQNIAGVGADVNIEAAQNRQHRDETHEVKQSGFTLGVGGTVGQVMGAAQKVSNASKSQDGRAAALWGIAAARDAYDGVNAIGDLMGGGAPGDKKPSANIQLGWGSSQSKQTLTEDSTSHSGSRVQAGGTAAFVATGIDADGNKTAGDLNVIGSSINAQKVALQAKHDVNMVSATDTDESRSTNKSSGFTVGVSVGTDGYGVSASVSKAKGNSDSAGTSQSNSQVRGSESVSIVSGNDTNLLGSTVAGGKVSVDAGGNLNLASRQDTNVMRADQQSMSAGASFSTLGGGGASASFMKGKASGNYANVAEQSGIYAGAGGFDINVKGNTDLKGAVIASDAGKDRNKLSTGTLTFSDVQNHSDYSATSFGATVGTSPTAMSPMIPQRKSGSQSGAARSAVAEGTIEIKDQSSQVQDVAALQRDTADTNKQVGTNPDLKNLLDKQADTMAAAQAAGAAIARTVGDYATAKQKDAEKQLKIAEGNFKADPSPENQAAIDAARADVAGWKEGGAYRAELHMAGGALVAGLGGGSALAGAAAAGLTSFAAPTLNNLSNAVASGVKTGNDKVDAVLGNLVANAVATGIGAAAGGGAGAAVANTVDAFNRQLHQDEYDKAKKFAKAVARELNISEKEAEARIIAEMLINSDKQTAEAAGGKHDYDIRRIVGCKDLNCKGSADPLYADHDYNSQYIAANQDAYDRAQGQLGRGQTYDELVISNIKRDPVGATLAGVGMVGLGYLTGGTGTAVGVKMVGAGVGAAANYAFQSGPTDWLDVGIAATTGFLTTGSGLGSSLATNVGGSLFGSRIKGENPNARIGGVFVGTVVGYGVGKAIEIPAAKVIDPRGWWTPDWVNLGYGISKWNAPSPIPGMMGGLFSNIAQEPTGNTVTNWVQGTQK